MKKITSCFLVLSLLAVLSGCTALEMLGGSQRETQFSELKANEFDTEAIRLQLLIDAPKASNAEKARSHRLLAFLFMTPENPSRSYDRAAKELGRFIDLTGNENDKNEARILQVTLKDAAKTKKDLKRLKKDSRTPAQIRKENDKLKKKVAELESSNEKLQKDIEKLKFLDLSLEKKRQNFRK